MKAKTSTEVLKAAKWIVEHVGWCKKSFTKHDKNDKLIGVCATQAIFAVDVDDDVRIEARQRLENAMGGNIIAFNDRPKTKKRDVIRAFNKAIGEK